MPASRSPPSVTGRGCWSRRTWSTASRVTCWPSIRTDLRNAGAEVVDEEAVIDGNIVTSRKPADIPAFTGAFIDLVETVEAEQPAWTLGASAIRALAPRRHSGR